MITPGILSLNIAVPKPCRGGASFLAPRPSPVELGEQNERRFKPKLPVLCPRPKSWVRRPHVPDCLQFQSDHPAVPARTHVFGGLENTVPELKRHLPPFKKGDSGTDSGFRCPPPTPPCGLEVPGWAIFPGRILPSRKSQGWPCDWRVRAFACNVQEEVRKGRSPI